MAVQVSEVVVGSACMVVHGTYVAIKVLNHALLCLPPRQSQESLQPWRSNKSTKINIITACVFCKVG